MVQPEQFNLTFDEFKLLELAVLTSVESTLRTLRPKKDKR